MTRTEAETKAREIALAILTGLRQGKWLGTIEFSEASLQAVTDAVFKHLEPLIRDWIPCSERLPTREDANRTEVLEAVLGKTKVTDFRDVGLGETGP